MSLNTIDVTRGAAVVVGAEVVEVVTVGAGVVGMLTVSLLLVPVLG